MSSSTVNSAPTAESTVTFNNTTTTASGEHKAASKAGAVTTNAADQIIGAGETAAGVAGDAYESGKAKASQVGAQAKKTGAELVETTKQGVETVKTKSKQTAAQVNAEAHSLVDRIRSSYANAVSAGPGEKPITFLGYNSMGIAKTGALLGLGLGVAGLFSAFTIYVPVSWILISAGTVSLIDLVSSLAYRSRVKSENPASHPLTAFSEDNALLANTTETDEDKIARVMGEVDGLKNHFVAKREAHDKTIAVIETDIEATQAEAQAQNAKLEALMQKQTEVVEAHNASATHAPEALAKLEAEIATVRDAAKQSKNKAESLQKDLTETLKASEAAQAKIKAQLQKSQETTRLMAGNDQRLAKLHEAVAQVSKETETKKTGEIVEITKTTTHIKGKARAA